MTKRPTLLILFALITAYACNNTTRKPETVIKNNHTTDTTTTVAMQATDTAETTAYGAAPER